MADSSLRESQMSMAAYLRNPQQEPAPVGIEPRRLKVYEDLVYNNVSGFISGGFPVLHSLYGSDDWQQLVRSFIAQHRCSSPFFLEISQEFLQYLMENHSLRGCDPPYMRELAHYEWVELALDVSELSLPPAEQVDDILGACVYLSPLAWVLQYQFPVHLVGPGNREISQDEPTFLAVYRDRSEQVKFMTLNAATARLLELLRDNPATALRELLARLASELGVAQDTVTTFGAQQVDSFLRCDLVLARRVEDEVDAKVAPLRSAE